MARIPMGNFGNAMPQVERIHLPEDQTGKMIAGALQNMSQVAGQYAETKDRQQRQAEASAKALALQNDQIAAQEAKVKLDDVITTEMSEQITLLKNDVSNGSKTAEVANQSLRTWSDVRYKELESELPGHAQSNLKTYWTENINQQSSSFLPLQLRADAQKGVVLADRYGEIATRYDRVKGRDYLESNLTTLNLSEADKQSRLYSYEGVRDQLEIDDRITVALEGKDIQSLQALQTDLNSNKFGYLDGKQIQQNKDRVLSRIDALNTQLKAETNKRNSEAGKFLNEYKANVLTGRAQDSEYESNIGSLVQGTEYEQEFQFYKAQSVNIQKFANLLTSEMLKRINQQKANMKNTASADAVTEEKLLGVFEGLYKDKLETAKNNPNQIVRETGLQVHSLSGAELKSNPSSWVSKAVQNGTSQLALKDPNVKVRPISAEDLPEAKKAFDSLSVQGKLDFIAQLQSQSKGHANAATIWGATLGQLGGGDQNYIAAGLARSNGFKSTDNRDLATSIVNGTQLLKNKQLIMPKEADLKAEFNAYVGNTVSGTTANNLFNVFKAIYVDTMDARGYQHAKSDDLPNKEILKTALSMATGGVYSQRGSFKNYADGKVQDWKVSKPYGMSDDSFEDRLDSGYSGISKSTGISESDLKSLRLRQSTVRTKKGDIQYDLINERGKPLVVNGVQWRIYMNGVTK
ncbi:methyl-coenzyme M reductase [Acinetobacter sp. YH01020]|uniref:methyl-coenzyme M reductase n=1 Tax=Acinetobacter sp. YH01020 TaxID=2601034 RepID=UPI0015D20E6E|nr:methyl-coenzyme M reductase [Acinetobacter sp. YH01020]